MSTFPFEFETFCDGLGPAKVVHLYDPGTGMRGLVVVDNVAAGPSIGGVRMAPDVGAREVFRLARVMTVATPAALQPVGYERRLRPPGALDRSRPGSWKLG